MTTVAKLARVPLVEIFASLQGEGRFVGVPMTFVRVAVCPLRCRYCDTPHSYRAPAYFPVGDEADAREIKNPVDAESAIELQRMVREQADYRYPTSIVSLTGGEPLLYPDFVAEFGARVRASGGRLHLETAAHDPSALAQCLGAVDHLSADLKLSETMSAQGGYPTELLAANLECVRLGVDAGVSVDIKVVLTNRTDPGGLAERLASLRQYADLDTDQVQLILQPVTPFGDENSPVEPTRLASAARVINSLGLRLRVLQQSHRTLGLR